MHEYKIQKSCEIQSQKISYGDEFWIESHDIEHILKPTNSH